MNPDKLLAHAEFVRSLARTLVFDEHRADDVEQKTWLAALEHPPASTGNLRSWLSRVIRNFVVTTYRGDVRRKKYEEAVPAVTAESTPEDVVLRKEALRSMTEAVLSLEEPYLSAILLRYYEDLSPPEVSDRLNIPLETVKTRLHRGLNLLRDRLDKSHDGNRMTWCLALAPLAGLKLATSAAATAAAASATVSAGSSAGSTAAASGPIFALKFGLLAALLLGTTFILHTVILDPSMELEEVEFLDPSMVSEVGTAGESDAIPVMSMLMEDGQIDLPSMRGDQNGRTALPPGGKRVAGRVTDLKTGDPIKVFDFYMRMVERKRIVSVIHETVRDENGFFSFPLEKGKYGEIAIWANHYTRKRTKWFETSSDDDLTGFEIELDHGLQVSGRVVDDETNRPVKGAIVGPAIYPWETDLVSLSLMGYEEGGIQDETGADGLFSIQGLRRIDERIAAVHPAYAEGYIYTRPGSGRDVEIRLKKGYHLYGRVQGDRGEPLEKVLIRLFGKGIPTCRPVFTGPDGRFKTPPVRPGRVFVKAGDPPMEMMDHPDFTEEMKIIDVVDGDVEINFGLSEEHLTWRGTLYGYNGMPETLGCLLIRPAECNHDEAYRYKFRRFIHCDGQGRFEVDKILPGRYRVDLMLSDPSSPDWFYWGIETFDMAGLVERDIDLHKGSTISGMVVDRSTGLPLDGRDGAVWAHLSTGRSRRFSADLDKEGRFELKGLVPGSYELHTYVDGCRDKTLAGIKVGEGTTLSDLRIPLSPLGRLQLSMVGFNDGFNDGFNEGEAVRIRPAFKGGESDRKFKNREFRIKSGEILKKEYDLEVGGWMVSLCCVNLGYIERRFDIFAGRDTELTVHRNEITTTHEFLSLAGKVTSNNGTPIEGLNITFKADDVPNLPPHNRVLKGTTDAGGHLDLAGFQPGRWWVTAQFSGDGALTLPQLWIPPDSPNPLSHHFFLDGGALTGTLVNRLTGFPVDSDHACKWSIRLQDLKKNCFIYNLEGESQGNPFQVQGISAGNYQLHVEAEGYEDYLSGSISLEEGQNLKLGEVMLEPCGILDLEVVDETLQPLDSFWIFCDGRRRFSKDSIQGRRRYNKLPSGPVTITIGAKGYLEQSIKRTLEPGRAIEARVVLRSNP